MAEVIDSAAPPAEIAPAPAPDYFSRAFLFVVDAEGRLSLDPEDPGNWTGGKIGAGLLRGTKFGISAASYPDVDIASLALDQAGEIYRRDYWNVCRCGELPAALGFVAFDTAVNMGVATAARLLQQTLGVPADGAIGPVTLAAARKADIAGTVLEFCARRALRYALDPKIERDGLGWMRRLMHAFASARSLI